MAGPVMCECGAMLVKDVDANGVTTLAGDYIRFQRRTDFVACAECMRTYPARDLLPPRPEKPQPVERLEGMLDENGS